MGIFEAAAGAFSLFSVFPVPGRLAEQGLRSRWLLCAFPLVGAAVGLVCWGWVWLCDWLGVPDLLRGAFLCLIPPALTGGIHLDGYADTCDALGSHSTPERKQRILRDPHCGAFAVIRLGMYFTGALALCTALPPQAVPALGWLLVFSRTLAAGLTASLPPAPESAMGRTLHAGADKWTRAVLYIEAGIAGAGLCLSTDHAVKVLLLTVPVVLVLLCRCTRLVRADFGGFSGDLAGWFLTKLEFWMLAMLVLSAFLEAEP